MNRNFSWLPKILIALILGVSASAAIALVFNLPPPNVQIIGEVQVTGAQKGDNFSKIARRYDIAFTPLINANQNLAQLKYLPINAQIIIPSMFILPNVKREGIIINLPEMRLYYFSADGRTVTTEPVSIGKYGWSTPLMQGRIIEKIRDPIWIVPESIVQEEIEQNKAELKTVVLPGPDNPLGRYALRLSNWSILIHGTNSPRNIGQRVSKIYIKM
jgi:L,D-transpeptidase ErfK/SrfK